MALFFVMGIVTFITGILISGPALLLLKELEIMSSIVLFLLFLIFIEVVILFFIVEQFVILVCLSRYFQKQAPIFNFKIFEGEMPRFMLYIKGCLFALVKICVGFLMLIVPGVRACFRYFFVGPIAVFEYREALTSDEILEKSVKLTEGKFLRLASLIIALFLFSFGSHFIFGKMIAHFILLPPLVTYFTICVVFFYKGTSRGSFRNLVGEKENEEL